MVPGPRLNIKITSHQYRKSHCGNKTILQSSYLHNGISYTGKMTSLYWIRALFASAPSHYLNPCWLVVDQNIRKITFFIQATELEQKVCKMAAFLHCTTLCYIQSPQKNHGTWTLAVSYNSISFHDAWWRHHMETFSALLALFCGEFTSHQWIPCTKASDVELWCFLWSVPWINGWVNKHEAADLRRQRAPHGVIIMGTSPRPLLGWWASQFLQNVWLAWTLRQVTSFEIVLN